MCVAIVFYTENRLTLDFMQNKKAKGYVLIILESYIKEPMLILATFKLNCGPISNPFCSWTY